MNTTEIKKLINQKAQKAENEFNDKLQGIIQFWSENSDDILAKMKP